MVKPTDKTAEEVFEAVQRLDPHEREKLEYLLAAGTDTRFFATPEIEQAWDEEIALRVRLMDEGKIQMHDGEEVMQALRKITDI